MPGAAAGLSAAHTAAANEAAVAVAQRVAAQMPCAPRSAPEVTWYYLDSIFQEFGPFTSKSMRHYLLQGRFPVGRNLLVRLPEWQWHMPLYTVFPDSTKAFVVPPLWDSAPATTTAAGRLQALSIGRLSPSSVQHLALTDDQHGNVDRGRAQAATSELVSEPTFGHSRPLSRPPMQRKHFSQSSNTVGGGMASRGVARNRSVSATGLAGWGEANSSSSGSGIVGTRQRLGSRGPPSVSLMADRAASGFRPQSRRSVSVGPVSSKVESGYRTSMPPWLDFTSCGTEGTMINNVPQEWVDFGIGADEESLVLANRQPSRLSHPWTEATGACCDMLMSSGDHFTGSPYAWSDWWTRGSEALTHARSRSPTGRFWFDSAIGGYRMSPPHMKFTPASSAMLHGPNPAPAASSASWQASSMSGIMAPCPSMETTDLWESMWGGSSPSHCLHEAHWPAATGMLPEPAASRDDRLLPRGTAREPAASCDISFADSTKRFIGIVQSISADGSPGIIESADAFEVYGSDVSVTDAELGSCKVGDEVIFRVRPSNADGPRQAYGLMRLTPVDPETSADAADQAQTRRPALIGDKETAPKAGAEDEDKLNLENLYEKLRENLMGRRTESLRPDDSAENKRDNNELLLGIDISNQDFVKSVLNVEDVPIQRAEQAELEKAAGVDTGKEDLTTAAMRSSTMPWVHLLQEP